MTIRIQADTDTDGVTHHWYPESGFGTLGFGRTGHSNNLFFFAVADIDEVIAELAALRAEMTGDVPPGTLAADPAYRLTPAGEAAAGRTWCPAVTVLDDETLYCDRDARHDGSHHAPGPDEGSEVAWSDEAVTA